MVGMDKSVDETSPVGWHGILCLLVLVVTLFFVFVSRSNTVTNDIVIATSDAMLRTSDRGLGLDFEVVGGGAAKVTLETRPGWRFYDGHTSVTLVKAVGAKAESPKAVSEGATSEDSGTITIVDGEGEENEGDSVLHEKPELFLSIDVPRVIAYSVFDGAASVSARISAKIEKKGVHRKVDANGRILEEREFSPKRYAWKMSGSASGEAETDTPTCTFDARLSKGKDKRLRFSVIGKRCAICDEEVDTEEFSESVEIDVYELSIARDDYLGLDRTEAGRQRREIKEAKLGIAPAFSGATHIRWVDCGICEFVGSVSGLNVKYQNKDHETASKDYLAERLAASVMLDGMTTAVTCATNFTVVKVDILRDKIPVSCGIFDVTVGEKLQLLGVMTPELMPIDKCVWSVPEKMVDDWVANNQSANVRYTPRESLMSKSIGFHWIEKMEGNTVGVSFLRGPLKIGCWVGFDVRRPRYRISTEMGDVSLSQDSLQFGDPETTPGIKIVLHDSEGEVWGMLDWVQICTNARREHLFEDGSCLVAETSGLDTEYPYCTGSVFTDSPQTKLAYQSTPKRQIRVKVDDAFCAYLLLKPFSPGAIWVPLASVTWGWSATAERNLDGTWELKEVSRINPICRDCETYPLWNRNARYFDVKTIEAGNGDNK